MKNFDYKELVEKVNKVNIELIDDEVITRYGDSVLAISKVSNRYEIFDFKPFVINCINEVMKSYELESYVLLLVRGVQEIRLYSKPEIIKGEEFRRTFYLLNSSDKSRALSFSYGLRHNNFDFILKGGTINKKHYKGITDYVEERIDLDDTIFQQQIEVLKKIIGDQILMSNVQKVIVENDILAEGKKSLQKNFEQVRYILYRKTDRTLPQEYRKKLYSYIGNSLVDFSDPVNDFMIDSFTVLKAYLSLFNRCDCSIIRRESERISELSVYQNRVSVLDELLTEE